MQELAKKEGVTRQRINQRVKRGDYSNVRQTPATFRYEIGLYEEVSKV